MPSGERELRVQKEMVTGEHQGGDIRLAGDMKRASSSEGAKLTHLIHNSSGSNRCCSESYAQANRS